MYRFLDVSTMRPSAPPWSQQAQRPFTRLLFVALVVSFGACSADVDDAAAGELSVALPGATQVEWVGAVRRWDVDGNALRPVNPKAKIDAPVTDAKAVATGTEHWQFANLPAGTYDLVIFIKPRKRIEGFIYPPVLEFDAFLKHTPTMDADVRAAILDDIRQSRHYENKVTALFMSRSKNTVRVLVQLLRDKKTSYDGKFGQPVATIRHEIWQYTSRYGAWVKEKRTRVLDRLLLARGNLRQWIWVWTPKLGGIEVPAQGHVNVRFPIPHTLPNGSIRGLPDTAN